MLRCGVRERCQLDGLPQRVVQSSVEESRWHSTGSDAFPLPPRADEQVRHRLGRCGQIGRGRSCGRSPAEQQIPRSRPSAESHHLSGNQLWHRRKPSQG